METLIVEDRVEGLRVKADLLHFTDQLKTFIALSLPEVSNRAQNRDEWSITVNQMS